MAPLLEVKDIELSFGGVQVLDSVSFEIEHGECLGLIGPNGAGKTSLINCLSRTYVNQAGSLTFNGRDLAKVRPHQIARLGMSRTFQNVELLPRSSVLRNTMVGAHANVRSTFAEGLFGVGRSPSDERTAERESRDLLHELGLSAVVDRPVGELPFGNQKLVEVARALLARPTLLLLDEPVAGTNLEERKVIASYIARMRQERNISLLLVEHDIGFVRSLADRVLALDFGRVIAWGPTQEVIESPVVISAYVGTSGTEV